MAELCSLLTWVLRKDLPTTSNCEGGIEVTVQFRVGTLSPDGWEFFARLSWPGRRG
jgi:hypothetical protein